MMRLNLRVDALLGAHVGGALVLERTSLPHLQAGLDGLTVAIQRIRRMRRGVMSKDKYWLMLRGHRRQLSRNGFECVAASMQDMHERPADGRGREIGLRHVDRLDGHLLSQAVNVQRWTPDDNVAGEPARVSVGLQSRNQWRRRLRIQQHRTEKARVVPAARIVRLGILELEDSEGLFLLQVVRMLAVHVAKTARRHASTGLAGKFAATVSTAFVPGARNTAAVSIASAASDATNEKVWAAICKCTDPRTR